MYGFLLLFYKICVFKMHRFWDIRLQKFRDLENRFFRQSLEKSPFSRARMTSYWRSVSCRFWDIQCRKMSWSWNPGQRTLKVIENGTIRKTRYGFLLVFYSVFLSSWDIRLVIIPWNPGYGSLKVIETDTNRCDTYDFLLNSIVTMGLSRTVSEINGDFGRKSSNFSHPVYLVSSLKEFPLELGIGARSQKLEWWGYHVVDKVLR